MSSQLVAGLAAVGMVVGGAAASAQVRSADLLPLVASLQGAPDGAKCAVNVVRSGTPGNAQITRATLADGSCVCTVTTGAAEVNGSAENVVTSLLRDRECTGAPGAANDLATKGAGPSAGGSGAILPVVLGAVAAGGLAAGLGSASKG